MISSFIFILLISASRSKVDASDSENLTDVETDFSEKKSVQDEFWEWFQIAFGRHPSKLTHTSYLNDTESVRSMMQDINKDPKLPKLVFIGVKHVSSELPYSDWDETEKNFPTLDPNEPKQGPFCRFIVFATPAGKTYVMDSFGFFQFPPEVLPIFEDNQRDYLIIMTGKNAEPFALRRTYKAEYNTSHFNLSNAVEISQIMDDLPKSAYKHEAITANEYVRKKLKINNTMMIANKITARPLEPNSNYTDKLLNELGREAISWLDISIYLALTTTANNTATRSLIDPETTQRKPAIAQPLLDRLSNLVGNKTFVDENFLQRGVREGPRNGSRKNDDSANRKANKQHGVVKVANMTMECEKLLRERHESIRGEYTSILGRSPGNYTESIVINDTMSIDYFISCVQNDTYMPNVVALDSEFIDRIDKHSGKLFDSLGFRTNGPFSRLIQFATLSGKSFVFDSYAFAHFPDKIWQFFNKDVTIVGFAYSSDVTAIQKTYVELKERINRWNIVDAQKIFQNQPTLYRMEFSGGKEGLKDLFSAAFGVSVDKFWQRGNWSVPLSDMPSDQFRYAAQDPVLHLDLLIYFIKVDLVKKEIVDKLGVMEKFKSIPHFHVEYNKCRQYSDKLDGKSDDLESDIENELAPDVQAMETKSNIEVETFGGGLAGFFDN